MVFHLLVLHLSFHSNTSLRGMKIWTSCSKYSFNEMDGIWVSFFLLIVWGGGTFLHVMKIGYIFTLHSGVSRGCFNISLIMPTIQFIRSMLHFTLLPGKFSIIMFLKYLDIAPFDYALYTLFIEESSNISNCRGFSLIPGKLIFIIL